MSRWAGWWNGRSASERRTLRWGALCVGVAILYAGAVRPAARWYGDTRERLARERDLLSRERAIVRDAGLWPGRFAIARRDLLAEAPRLFDGSDTLAAVGNVARYVTSQALAERVYIQAAEPRPVVTAGDGVAALVIEVRGVSDLRGLLGFLQAIDRGPRLVRIERLAIVPQERAPGLPVVDDESLGFVATVRGFALITPSSAPGTPR